MYRVKHESSPASVLPEQAGYTLIELLVSMAIVAILAGLSIQAFISYSESSYESLSQQTVLQAVTALEAGKSTQEEFSADWLTFWSETPGVPNTAAGQELIPGMIIPNDVQIYVQHDDACADEFCVEDYLQVRHCKADTYTAWWRLRGGYQSLDTISADWDC